jgi:NAD(P)-dependent dehydrogenase (short-subunit alcohol dehydrogenase family)
VSGSILFFSGVLSHKPMPGATIIGAVNGAIDALGRGLAVELAPVRVNVISPGLVQGTEAFSDMTEDDRRGMFEGAARNLPAGLVGDGDSVAGIACALLASPYATGSIVAVDGGGILI